MRAWAASAFSSMGWFGVPLLLGSIAIVGLFGARLLPPRSGAIGMKVFPGMVASNGELLILAIQRQGETLPPRETALTTGDTLLVQGTWDALDASHDDADVLVVDSPDIVRRQAVPMG